jgi:hypothetical protein
MTATEILNEIQKLPLPEQRALVDKLQQNLTPANGDASEAAEITADELERRERELELEMLAKGVFSSIPDHTMTDEEFFEDFELLEIEGEPLSEQIIRERR